MFALQVLKKSDDGKGTILKTANNLASFSFFQRGSVQVSTSFPVSSFMRTDLTLFHNSV